MNSFSDEVFFHLNVLTGSLLLLSVLSMLGIYLMTNWLCDPSKVVVAREDGGKTKLSMKASPNFFACTLLGGVIFVNVLAMYTNFSLREANEKLLTLIVDSETSLLESEAPRKVPTVKMSPNEEKQAGVDLAATVGGE